MVAMETLRQEIHQLKPPLKQDFAPLMMLCESLKANEGILKQVLREFPDAEPVHQLRAAIAVLLRDLDHALTPMDAALPSAADKLNLEQIRKLCHALAVCVPSRGTSLIDTGPTGRCDEVQRITNHLLKRATVLTREEPAQEIGEALDRMNWVSRGLAKGLLTASTEVVDFMTNAIGLIAAWTGGDHSRGTVSKHNFGRCARQLSTIMKHTGLCESPKESGKSSAAVIQLGVAINKLCSLSVVECLAQAPQDVVSLQNLCTMIKDALDHKQIAANDTKLLPALERLTTTMAEFDTDQLLPLDMATGQPSSPTRDCRPLVTFANFIREVAESRLLRHGVITLELPALELASAKLLTLITLPAFGQSQPNAVQLSNLISFVKICHKLSVLRPQRAAAASTTLMSTNGKVLVRMMLKLTPDSYAAPGQQAGILAGLAYLGQQGLADQSDALKKFCAALLTQIEAERSEKWDDWSRGMLQSALQQLVEARLSTQARTSEVLAAVQPQVQITHTRAANNLPAPDKVDGWQQPKKSAKPLQPDALLHSAPAMVVKQTVRQQPVARQSADKHSSTKVKPAQQQKPGKPQKAKQQTSKKQQRPSCVAEAIANGDATSVKSLLVPPFDIRLILQQSLAAVEWVDDAVLQAFDTLFTQAEALQPDTARKTITACFAQQPAPFEGLHALLKRRGYVASPPDLAPLREFSGMLNFLGTASDEDFERHAALPEFGRLLLNKSESRDTFLHKAIERNDRLALQRLLGIPGAKDLPLARNKAGQTPLHAAIIGKLPQMAAILLSHPSQLEQAITPDTEGCVPLMRAIEAYDNATVDRLLSLDNAAQQAKAVDKRNAAALNFAATNDNVFAAGRLLALPSAQIQTLATDEAGDTPLARSARFGSTNVLRLLLAQTNASEQIRRTNRDGYNALHLAVMHGRMATVRELLSTAWAESMASASGRASGNALMLAAETGRAEAVQALLSMPWSSLLMKRSGADGNIARELASKGGHASIVEMLDRFAAASTKDS
jgi:ankyrin repeat protein